MFPQLEVQWDVNKCFMCMLSRNDCVFLEMFYFDYQVKILIVKLNQSSTKL